MNDALHDLLPIGTFSRAAQISIKALRHYAQLSLLAPRYIDPESGYRYYHSDQLREARLIRMMRQVDMPLATIRAVLVAAPEEAEALVQNYWQSFESQIVQARRLVLDLVLYLRQEATMALEVHARAAAAQPIVSMTKRWTVEQLYREFWPNLKTLYAVVAAQGGMVAGFPFGIFHGAVNEEEDGSYELCIPVQHVLTTEGEIHSRELPSGRLASVLLDGEEARYPASLAGYDAVYDWIHRQGYEVADAPRVIYHRLASDEDQRREIAWPFRELPAGASQPDEPG
jgi:DNA-binding transcriptional MerR regulator/DNA gyrase inhibitor GyrI